MIVALALTAVAGAPTPRLVPTLLDDPHSPDGVHYHDGPYRVEVHDGGITVADEAFSSRIVAFAPVPAGWVFVTQDGVVATSASFTGPLTRIGQVARTVSSDDVTVGDGRLTVTDGDGTVWITDGDAPRVLAGPPGSGPALTGAFIDTKVGAITTVGGFVWKTADGGATWTAVDAQSSGVRYGYDPKHPEAPRRLVYLTGRNVGHAIAEGTPGPRPAKLTAAQNDAFNHFYFTHAALTFGSVHRDDGTVWQLGEDRFTAFDAAGHGTDLPEAPGGCLDLQKWGKEAVASCPDRDAEPEPPATDDPEGYAARRAQDEADLRAPMNLYAFDGASWRKLSGGGRHFLADPAGDVLVASGPCGPLCATVDGGTQWDPLPVGGYDPQVVSIGDGKAIVDEGGGKWRAVDLEAGTGADVVLPAGQPDGARFAGMHVVAGEIIATLATADQGPPYALAVGVPRALVVHPLPEGAVAADLQDARDGLAVGKDASVGLWTTRDGGAHWKHVAIPVDGDPAAIALSHVSCTASGCKASGSLVDVVLSGDAPARVLAPSALSTATPAALLPAGHAICTVAPDRTTAVAAAEGDRTLLEGPVDAVIDVADGTATVRWIDDAGAAHASAPFPATGDEDRWEVVASRPSALFVASYGSAALVVEGAAPVAVDAPGDLGRPVDDGTGGWWFRSGIYDSRSPYEAWHLAADGTTGDAKRYLPDQPDIGAAGFPALVWRAGDGLDAISLTDRSYAHVAVGAPKLCTAPAGARVAWLPVPDDALSLGGGSPTGAQALWDLDAGCIAAFYDSDGGVVRSAGAGALAGRDKYAHAVSCTWTP